MDSGAAQPHWRRVAILGVGLIGGSLARVLKAQGAADQIIGCGRQRQNLETARRLGIIDQFVLDPVQAVREADLVLLGAPVLATTALLAEIAPHLTEQVVVTDVASVKGVVVEAARQQLGEKLARFVPAHPIAGAESSGAAASRADLFIDHRVVLTPLAQTAVDALEQVRALWRLTGALVEEMSVQHHDQIFAATSHLPHLLAFTLVNAVARQGGGEEGIIHYAAGGFRDMTRIAASDPTMWHDIFLTNKEALLHSLEQFQQELEVFRQAIVEDDSAQISKMLLRARTVRNKLSNSN